MLYTVHLSRSLFYIGLGEVEEEAIDNRRNGLSDYDKRNQKAPVDKPVELAGPYKSPKETERKANDKMSITQLTSNKKPDKTIPDVCVGKDGHATECQINDGDNVANRTKSVKEKDNEPRVDKKDQKESIEEKNTNIEIDKDKGTKFSEDEQKESEIDKKDKLKKTVEDDQRKSGVNKTDKKSNSMADKQSKSGLDNKDKKAFPEISIPNEEDEAEKEGYEEDDIADDMMEFLNIDRKRSRRSTTTDSGLGDDDYR